MKNQPDILVAVSDLVEIAGKMPTSNVVVPGGHRREDLKLVEAARDHGIVDRIILVGSRPEIERSISELGIWIRPDHIVATRSPDETAAATVELVKSGQADIVLKGDISTPIINRALQPLAVRTTVSLATVFDAAPISSGRPMVLTDAGFTTVCNFGRMVDLVYNACDVARLVLGIPRPRVAILSANEKPIPSLPSTWLGKKLAERTWEDAVVYGPLSLDLATDPDSVALKGISANPAAREVAGRADVLVCPGIDTANTLYKTITALNKYGLASLAGITVGFPFSYIILSRADTLETRLESIALCSVFVQRLRLSAPRRPRAVVKPALPARRILVFQPGAGYLQAAVFAGEGMRHFHREPDPSSPAGRTVEELTDRVREIVRGWKIRRIDAIAVPGGALSPPAGHHSGGVYRIAVLRSGKIAVERGIVAAAREHPENYGVPVAAALARIFGAVAYAAVPAGDEISPAAAVSGYGGIVRGGGGVALALSLAARRAAGQIRRPPEEVNLVVAHLDREVMVAAMRGDRIVDSSASSFGEDRMEAIEEQIAGGDNRAAAAVEGMIHRIAKEIGAMFVAAGCDVEAIVLTGDLVRNKRVRTEVRKRVNRLAPVMILAGSLEMEALAAAAAGALAGAPAPLRYERSRPL